MSKIAVAHVRFLADWEALYVQGELVEEGHNISIGDVLEHIEGHEVTYATSEYNDVNLSDEFGATAPEQYSALPPA